MRTTYVLLAAPLLMAASPPQRLSLQIMPDYPFTAKVPAVASRQSAGPVYEPAPLPNPNVLPPAQAQRGGTELSPTLFQRRDAYRGASFNRGETAESDQDRKHMPSAGFTLKMPLDEGENR